MKEDKKDQNELDEKSVAKAEISAAEMEIFQEMMKAGTMYGHHKSKTNPKCRPFIFGNRGGVEIIDLAATIAGISDTAEFLNQKIKSGGKVLIVATQPASREAVMLLHEKFDFPYINTRWIGGLLTNFKNLSARIENYKKTKEGLEKGSFEKYTKKERVIIAKKLEKMERNYSGLENLDRIPDAILIIDPSIKGHTTALKEAKITKVPVIAILDNDDNPNLVNNAIPANDHAKTSIDWIINKIIQTIK